MQVRGAYGKESRRFIPVSSECGKAARGKSAIAPMTEFSRLPCQPVFQTPFEDDATALCLSLPSRRYFLANCEHIREPSLGLAPLIVEGIFKVIAKFRQHDISVLLVEQNAALALEFASWAYALSHGQIRFSQASAELRDSDLVRSAYLA